jgi:hypothetical protein
MQKRSQIAPGISTAARVVRIIFLLCRQAGSFQATLKSNNQRYVYSERRPSPH